MSANQSSRSMSAVEPSKILSKALTTGFGSDMVIKCGDQEWKVHKLIISLASPVLMAACKEQWKEGLEGVIVLGDPEDKSDISSDPVAVGHMISFIYNGDYLYESKIVEEKTNKHLDGWGDEVDEDWQGLTPLEEEAFKKLEERQKTEKLENSELMCLHAKLYALGEKYNIPKLKHAALKKFELDHERLAEDDDAFYDAAKIVFTTTTYGDRDLRDLVVKVLDHMEPYKFGLRLTERIVDLPDLATQLWLHAKKKDGKLCDECSGVSERTCEKKFWYTNDYGEEEYNLCGRKFFACLCGARRCSEH